MVQTVTVKTEDARPHCVPAFKGGTGLGCAASEKVGFCMDMTLFNAEKPRKLCTPKLPKITWPKMPDDGIVAWLGDHVKDCRCSRCCDSYQHSSSPLSAGAHVAIVLGFIAIASFVFWMLSIAYWAFIATLGILASIGVLLWVIYLFMRDTGMPRVYGIPFIIAACFGLELTRRFVLGWIIFEFMTKSLIPGWL